MRICTGAPVARKEERIGSTIPMPTFASRPSTKSSTIPVELPQNYMVRQQRQQTHTFNVFLLEDKIQKLRVCICSQFPKEALLWIKEVEMVDSVDELKSAINCSVLISRISKFWTRDLLLH